MIENVSEEPTRKIVTKLGLVSDVNANQISQAMDLLRSIVTGASEKIDEKVIVGFSGFIINTGE